MSEAPEVNKIYLSDVLTWLKSCPDDFLDCVVTSPPYYALRAYGTPPQIWDGDDDCDHDWHQTFTPRPNGSGGKSGVVEHHEGQRYVEYKDRRVVSDYCSKCRAWRGELGQEPTHLEYINHLKQIFAEIYRCLKPTGTCWVNIADTYNASRNSNRNGADGSLGKAKVRGGGEYQTQKRDVKASGVKLKSQLNIPARFAIMMTDDLGFIQRNVCNWWKRSTMPSSAKDRFTNDFEPIFFFSKSHKYFFTTQYEKAKGKIGPRKPKVSRENSGRAVPVDRAGNPNGEERIMRTSWEDFELHYEFPYEMPLSTYWDVNTANGEDRGDTEHYAAYPTRLVEIPILAGCPEGGLVYDPFMGTGTTALAAIRLGRNFIGTEIQATYHEALTNRLETELVKGRLF